MKRIVITGAGGMIGTTIAEQALKSGIEVVAIVRPGKQMNIAYGGLTVVECDLSDLENCNISVQCDAFLHLAWGKTTGSGRDDADTQLRNVEATLSAVRLAKKCGCEVFVGAGSQAEYGIVNCPVNGDTPVNPLSGYGIAKYTAGKMSALLCAQLGIRHCWTRILSVYGENDRDSSLISYCIDSFLKNESPELSLCEQLWDYIYASDAADAILAVAQSGVDGKTYCIGSGRCRSLSEYVLDICRLTGSSAEPCFGKREYFSNQPMFLCADISELTRDTGFSPTVSFDEGIARVIEKRKKNCPV